MRRFPAPALPRGAGPCLSERLRRYWTMAESKRKAAGISKRRMPPRITPMTA
jgi:hypothetical protein